MTPSILLLDKPLGLSSNAALQKVRWLFGKPRPKAGHTGTLDPLATGMLPICLGEATKFAGQLLSETKCYRTRIAFGMETASGDRDGETVATAALPVLEAGRIDAVLREFTGTIRQTPPAYSAIKQDGVPLYRLARAGVPVQPGQRDVRIERIEVLEFGAAHLDLEVECGSGTYIRTLGMDIARALGSVGHLASLRRLWVAPFQRRPMASIDDIAAWRQRPSESPPWLLPVEAALPGFAVLALDAAAVSALKQGRRVGGCDRPSGTYRLHDADAAFFGLGDVDEAGVLRVRRLLATGDA